MRVYMVLNQAKRLICRIENRLPFSDTKIEIWETDDQNFYLLKIHLNLCEILNRVLKSDIWI